MLVCGGLYGGGLDGSYNTNSAEIYDPGRNAWTAAARMSVDRMGHAVAALPDGRVLVCGGRSYSLTAEIYYPGLNAWTATAPIGQKWYKPAAAAL